MKHRKNLSKDLTKLDIEQEWWLIEDFNMVKCYNNFLNNVNVYAPNIAKHRKNLSKGLAELDVEREWCLVRDFNMVEKKQNNLILFLFWQD